MKGIRIRGRGGLEKRSYIEKISKGGKKYVGESVGMMCMN